MFWAIIEGESFTMTFIYYFIFILLFLIIFINLVIFFMEFSKDLKYIKMEIRRTCGREQKYWIRRKRRLWLSLIPFVRFKSGSKHKHHKSRKTSRH